MHYPYRKLWLLLHQSIKLYFVITKKLFVEDQILLQIHEHLTTSLHSLSLRHGVIVSRQTCCFQFQLKLLLRVTHRRNFNAEALVNGTENQLSKHLPTWDIVLSSWSCKVIFYGDVTETCLRGCTESNRERNLQSANR